VALLLAAFCLPHTFPEPVFWAMLAAGLAYVCGPMLRAVWDGGVGPVGDATVRGDAESRKPPAVISSEMGSV
jgi:hypothetical protein